MRKLTLVGVLAALTLGIGALPAPAARRIGKIVVNSGESIQCPSGTTSCVVTVQATGHDGHNRTLTLGHATIVIAPASTARLIFKLNGTGKRLLLTHGPLRAKLTVTVRAGTDPPIVSSHPITIGVPKKRHGHTR